jgi:hypothetical protein
MNKLRQTLVAWSIENELAIQTTIEYIREREALGERGTTAYILAEWALKNNATINKPNPYGWSIESADADTSGLCFMRIACETHMVDGPDGPYTINIAPAVVPMIFIGDACRECYMLQKEWEQESAYLDRQYDEARKRGW